MVRLRRLASKYYRELFESASEAIWIHDLDGKIIAANRAAEELSGYSVDEQYDLNVGLFLDEEGLVQARQVRETLLRGEPVDKRYEQKIRRRDGTEAILELATSLIIDKGQPVAFQHIARDVTEERRLQHSLRYYLQAILRAQEDERKRIARELHDEIVQSLLLLIRRLDSIISQSSEKKPSKSMREQLEELRGLAVSACDELWRYAHDLRPRILDDMGLLAGLEYLADEARKDDGVDVRVQVKGTMSEMTGEAQLVMFRIAQEALNNVRRYAEASEVLVQLEFQETKVGLTLTDNGNGFVVPTQIDDFTSMGRLGLRGMYERARLLGGSLDIQSELGKGTKVAVEIPLESVLAEPERSDSL